jgi:hypothetical protein
MFPFLLQGQASRICQVAGFPRCASLKEFQAMKGINGNKTLPAKDDQKSEYHTCEESRQKHHTLALARPLLRAERQVRLKVSV